MSHCVTKRKFSVVPPFSRKKKFVFFFSLFLIVCFFLFKNATLPLSCALPSRDIHLRCRSSRTVRQRLQQLHQGLDALGCIVQVFGKCVRREQQQERLQYFSGEEACFPLVVLIIRHGLPLPKHNSRRPLLSSLRQQLWLLLLLLLLLLQEDSP